MIDPTDFELKCMEKSLRFFGEYAAEIGYHYLRERLQNMAFDKNFMPLIRKNLVITPQFKMLLNEDGVEATSKAIAHHFPDAPVDIMVVDPLRNVFDGGTSDAGENDNAAMLFFLQQRLEVHSVSRKTTWLALWRFT